MAEKRGFEPLRPVTDLLAFQASPFSLLGTSPKSGRAREIRTLGLGVRVRCLNRLAMAQSNFFTNYNYNFICKIIKQKNRYSISVMKSRLLVSLIASIIKDFITLMSISSSFFMYKHPLPVLYFPRLLSSINLLIS